MKLGTTCILGLVAVAQLTITFALATLTLALVHVVMMKLVPLLLRIIMMPSICITLIPIMVSLPE